jgi:hypothetical protein
MKIHIVSQQITTYRSFKVAKAIKPKMMDTIQKRTTTFVSGQPFFSK